MSYLSSQDKLAAYSKMGAHSAVEVASPHRLIQMLLGGAIDKIAMAKGHMERKDVAATGSHISWAISIVDGLRMSLDHSIESPITSNLDALYDYINRKLLEANMEKKVALLNEASGLLHEIKSAWAQIPEDAQNAHDEKEK